MDKNLIIPLAYKYAKGVYSFLVSSVCPSVCPLFHPLTLSLTKFYFEVFLISYNSAATDQKLFIFGVGVPGRVLFHSTSMNIWVMPQGGARGQTLGHPNKVVYCSLFIQTT